VLPLHLISWPRRSSPAKVSVFKDSPDTTTWMKANIMLRNLDKQFLVMFRTKGPSLRSGSLEIAVDDVQVVGGGCGKGRRRRRWSERRLGRKKA
jgi:hypothetical protein